MPPVKPSRPGPNVGRNEAARILDRLGLCKAHGPGGSVNGPNCQRFGERDPRTKRWSWNVYELLTKAREKKSASSEVIHKVAEQYAVLLDEAAETSAIPRKVLSPHSDLIESFRQSVRRLESALLHFLPERSESKSGLGGLIRYARDLEKLGRVDVDELYFINSVRNSLFHPSPGEASDDQLARALESADALTSRLNRGS